MKKSVLSIVALLSAGLTTLAVETQTWNHSSLEDFSKGELHKLSLRSDGRLFLAPKSEELLDSSVGVLWAIAEDSRGNVYAGGGGSGGRSAKLYRVDPSGNTKVLAQLEGLAVQAIAIDSRDRVFAATAPDGEVYKISADGEAEVFYDPQAKYIWALAFDSRGDLYVATGDAGEIHRVKPNGEGSVFFKTEETHARSLAVDKSDNLIVGTEPSGLVMRVSPAGEGFVLYQSGKREITSVAVAPGGRIYAAGIGAKKPAGAAPVAPVRSIPVRPATATATAGPAAPNVPAAAQAARPTARPALPPIRTRVTGGSEVYRIDPDGYYRTVWSDKEEIVYSIAIDQTGRPVFGTGNNGRIYRLDSEHLHTMLIELSPTQVTALCAGEGGKLFAATGNIGKLFAVGPELETEGSYEADVLDAGHFSYWGRIGFRGERHGGEVRVEARSGNLDRPQQNWSPWTPVRLRSTDGRVGAPPARFLQYKLTLAASSSGDSPEITSVDTAYQNKNVAPVVKKIAATPPNYRFPAQSLTLTKSKNITLPSLSGKKRPTPPKPVTSSGTQTVQYAKGQIGARWLAEDDNRDTLRYKVEIRGEGETEWKLLKDDLDKPYLSWDSTAYPDGEYRLRVTASDAPDNPPQHALTASLEGEPFLIDNTPPSVGDLSGSRDGASLEVTWRAVDANTVIKKAEYSLDGGDWTVVEPKSLLSDSKDLDFEVTIEAPEAGEHTVAIRVTDLFDNQSVAKTVIR